MISRIWRQTSQWLDVLEHDMAYLGLRPIEWLSGLSRVPKTTCIMKLFNMGSNQNG